MGDWPHRGGGGQPPKPLALKLLRQMARERSLEALEVLTSIMRGQVDGAGAKEQHRAAEAILVWGAGRPSTWAEDEAAGIPEAFRKLPKSEQARLIRAEKVKLELYEATLSEDEVLQ